MRTVAIIQARRGSTRLPGKVLMALNGQSVLERVIRRIQAVNILRPGIIDEVVVATTTLPADDLICEWTRDLGVACFRGHSTDLLDRYYRCAKKYKAGRILRITADCPLIEPVLVAQLLDYAPNREYLALPFNRGDIPNGWDAEVFSFGLLERTWTKAKEREHLTKEMRVKFQDYLDVELKELHLGKISLTLDTLEDYDNLQEYLVCLEGKRG